MNGLLAIVVAYVLGSIPFGYLLVRLTGGGDVRQHGSGNIGATNVARAFGPWQGVATLALDIAKGYVAVWLGGLLTGESMNWMAAAALAAMAGHSYPLFLRFQGGKAVATFAGAFLYLTPVPMLATLAVFLVTAALTGFVSSGSVLAAGAFPVGVWLILHPPAAVLAAAAVAGGFVIYRHRSNLQRLREGRETRFRWTRS